jgi:hypothetical protein
LTLLFKRQFISKIREGNKTQTRRLKQPRLKIDKEYPLRENYQSVLPDKIMITDIFQQYLGEIIKEDIRKKGFRNIEEFIMTWRNLRLLMIPMN